ncbi:type II toxin-antitoxin system RelE/ParE family toxin [uncultured Thiohalocapsa sp.]|uniref:type II toxin-antitoxin system RelE/ParE family toxin n=1 Tax=uncultured Thiohalocapsa sp. TaxID=768990 RepID=UPI0025F1B22A|nr:type II toxin-antitoxin system RelE/ParE family toxin [uncultured Thiohalocapsa sp.]
MTRSAMRHLRRLRDFIAEHDPAAAARVGTRLARTIRLLREQPALGIAVDGVAGVRELATGNYVVRYTLRDEAVVVLRIWHGRESR